MPINGKSSQFLPVYKNLQSFVIFIKNSLNSEVYSLNFTSVNISNFKKFLLEM